MRLSSNFLIFFFLLFKCNGAPAGEEVPTNTHPRGTNFTYEEDMLIIEELGRLPDNDLQRMSSKYLWEHVTKKHREKCQQNTPGFPQERSSETLRYRLRKLINQNDSEPRVRVPEKLLKRFRPDLNKPPRGKNPAYTPAEEQLIFEELLNPSCTHLNSGSTLQVIHAKHHARWQALTPGFETERTIASIQSHMIIMKNLGHLPDAVVKKFGLNEKGASSSRSAAQ